MASNFELAVQVLAKVDSAVKEIDKLTKIIENLEKKTEQMGQKNTMTISKVAKTWALVGATAGAAMAAMIEGSPSLQAAFFMIRMEMQLMWMEIGEELAPVITDVLLPAFNSLRDWVTGLSPELQTFIGATIAMTVAISALAAAFVVLNAVSLPLIVAILAIGAAFAWIFLAVTGQLDGLKDKSEGWRAAIEITVIAVQLLGDMVQTLFLWIGNILTSTWTALKQMWDAVLGILGGFATMGMGIGQVFQGVFMLFTNFSEGIKLIWKGIGNFIIGILNVVIGIINIIWSAIRWVINGVLGLIEGALRAIGADAWADSVLGWMTTIDTWDIPTIKTLHEGGMVGGSVEQMMLLKPGERVRTETQERALQRGGGGNGGGVNVTIKLNNAMFADRRMLDQLAKQVATRVEQIQYKQAYRRTHK